MAESRTKNSLKNYSMSVVSQVTSILLSFIGRTFFIKILSIEYLGVNGLFSNILSLLSLAELGVSTAITYMMYKPIAENDKEKVAAYNQLFRKIYNFIGLFILLAGLSLTPFIHHLIKNEPQISENIHIIYALFIINSAISYFYTYKRALLIAHQKEYINNTNIIEFAIIKDIVLILLLYIFHNYYFYLTAQILITFASNISISIKTNKLFPDIVSMKPVKVSRTEIRAIIKNTAAMLCHKIGSVIVSGTGNIFISYFVGLATVGIYSNYVLISQAACQIVGKGVNSLTASFGNLVATAQQAEIYRVFKRIYFINFILALNISTLFYALIDPFISLWIGADYLLETKTSIIIVINSLFFYQIRVPSQMVINTYGLFWQIKWKSLIEAVINLCCSFLFAAYLQMGIIGILLAGLVSNVTTSLWWEPYVATKYGLNTTMKDYLLEFMKNILILFTALLTISFLNKQIDTVVQLPIPNMIARSVATLSVSTILILLFYHKTKEFKYIVSFIPRNRPMK